MMLLEARGLSAGYGTRVLFQNLSLSIDSGDKIGLIGHNGSGKSTILRMLSGTTDAPGAEFLSSTQLQMEYLSQHHRFQPEHTILEEVFAGTSAVFEAVRTYNHAQAALHARPHDEAAGHAFFAAQETMDRLDAWQLESNAKSILHRLGLEDPTARVDTLSGGQQKRLALAQVLIRPANLLLLDEPTNHLDYNTIQWLEDELRERNCALLLVTHDRYFLDRICNTILELDNGTLYRHVGNYETFLQNKAERAADAARRDEKLMRLYKQELAWMRKGVEARRTKQKARKDRFATLENALPQEDTQALEMSFRQARLGKKIMHLEDLHKAFGSKCLIDNFSYAFVRDDRIGIIGDNGSGKTSLLNILADRDHDFSGTLERGETLRIGYYRQDNMVLDENQKVIDYVRDQGEYITRADGTRVSASRMLQSFLFRPEQQHAAIGMLSGGEKRRLYLLGILMQDVNMLLLDEPTNDLDIGTLQILEDFLAQFPGPVVVVSHDRYFLDRICTRIFAFEGNGQVRIVAGQFSDYLEKYPRVSEAQAKTPVAPKEERKRPSQPAPLKLTWREEQDYATIEEDIATLEDQLSTIDLDMAAASSDYTRLLTLETERNTLQAALDEKIDRWTYLEEKLEQIRNAKKD